MNRLTQALFFLLLTSPSIAWACGNAFSSPKYSWVKDASEIGMVVCGALTVLSALILLGTSAWRFFNSEKPHTQAALWQGVSFVTVLTLPLFMTGLLLMPQDSSVTLIAAFLSGAPTLIITAVLHKQLTRGTPTSFKKGVALGSLVTLLGCIVLTIATLNLTEQNESSFGPPDVNAQEIKF